MNNHRNIGVGAFIQLTQPNTRMVAVWHYNSRDYAWLTALTAELTSSNNTPCEVLQLLLLDRVLPMDAAEAVRVQILCGATIILGQIL
jgi:hypothetical protein